MATVALLQQKKNNNATITFARKERKGKKWKRKRKQPSKASSS